MRASTTGKQQRGCEHYWDRTGADIHYWQAAESAIVGRKLLGEKDSEEFFLDCWWALFGNRAAEMNNEGDSVY